MKFGVVQFPGSNCDDDACHAIALVIEQPVEFVWHQSEDLAGFDAIILPGGFAYGDYLRTGAIARFSPVMKAVEWFARGGGLGAGDLQWVSDSARGWVAAGGDAAEQGAAISVPARAYPRGADGHAVYGRGAARRCAEDSDRAQ